MQAGFIDIGKVKSDFYALRCLQIILKAKFKILNEFINFK